MKASTKLLTSGGPKLARRPMLTAPLGLVWIKCSDPRAAMAVISLERTLEGKVCIQDELEPSAARTLSSIVLCPGGEDDVTQELYSLQHRAPGVPILVLCTGADANLAGEVLRAGACGFVHVGMRPEQIAHAIAQVSKGEVVIPRELLGGLVGQRLFLRMPQLLES